MMELLHFIFSSAWHFIGTLLLLSVALEGMASVIRAVRGKP